MFRRTMMAAACAVTGALAVPGLGSTALAQDAGELVTLNLKDGPVVIRLRPDLAPKMVARFKQLVSEGFYNGTPFHRVIEGFMAQGGDPSGSGTGGSKYPNVPGEFSNAAHFLRGTVGAARTNDPDTANSQFFICLAPASFLDGKYTVFGQVISGMENVDKIKKAQTSSGIVSGPDKIVSMTLGGK